MRSTSSLCVEGLHVSYGGHSVLRGLNFDAWPGTLTGVVGPNGGGKTTLLRAILQLVPGQRGSVTIDGRPPGSRGDEVSYVPQQAQVDWEYPITVSELVRLGLYPRAGWLQRLTPDLRQRFRAALDDVGMLELADRPVSELSGGQRQRATIARAIAADAPTVLLDEPFAAVDAATAALIWKVMARFCDEGKRVLLVHHDLADIARADQLVLVSRIGTAVGTPHEVLASPVFARAFGASYETLTHPSGPQRSGDRHDRRVADRAAA